MMLAMPVRDAWIAMFSPYCLRVQAHVAALSVAVLLHSERVFQCDVNYKQSWPLVAERHAQAKLQQCVQIDASTYICADVFV